MTALLLCLVLFLFWTVLGYGLVVSLESERNPLANLLLAPVLGAAVTVVAVFTFSRFGLPVGSFGRALTAALLVATVALWAWRRPAIPWRLYLPFAAVFFGAMLLVGWPMIGYGFDWMGYCNWDMTFYCLGAQRFYHHGYCEPPDWSALDSGRDFSQLFWFYYNPIGHRAGCELLLAWLMSGTGLTAHQAYMPLLLAVQLALLSGSGALVLQCAAQRRVAWLTCLLLAVSPLLTLGVIYQVTPQVGGLAVLAALCVVLMRPFDSASRRIGAGLGAGILAAALVILYVEYVPFLVLSLALYWVVLACRRQLHIAATLGVVGLAAATVVLLTRTHVLEAGRFLLVQCGRGFRPTGTDPVFPYFLAPSGLAKLWGLLTCYAIGQEPWLSLAIAVGGCLLVFAAAASVRLAWQGHPVAIVNVVMLALAVELFAKQSDYGLFKLAMFIQPFLLGTALIAWLRPTVSLRLGLVPVVILGPFLALSQFSMVRKSVDGSATCVGIPHANSGRINQEFSELLVGLPARTLVSDTVNRALMQIQVYYTRGIPTFFPADSMTARKQRLVERCGLGAADPSATQRLIALRDPAAPAAGLVCDVDPAAAVLHPDDEHTYLIGATGRQSALNRRIHGDDARNFFVQPTAAVRNHLILRQFWQGALSRRQHEDLLVLEPDPMFPGQTFAGVWRYVLCEVLQATPRARVVMHITATPISGRNSALPPAAVVGRQRVAFPLVGAGSARVVSPPLSPQEVAGLPFYALDMGADGRRFADPKLGLMKLYGKDVPTDSRRLTGFLRDLSLITEEEYAEFRPPTALQRFPADLQTPDLEYSGMAENGSLSLAGFVRLTQPAGARRLVLRGKVAAAQTIRLLLDERQIHEQTLSAGEFVLDVPVKTAAGLHRIAWRFAATDDQPAFLAPVQYLGFQD